MTYKIFLDDLREIEEIYPGKKDEYRLCRSYYDALAKIRLNGCPSFISFDNDLGENMPEGYNLAKAIVELDMDGMIIIPADFSWHVHSANCKAWENIDSYLQNYLKQK